MSRHLPILQDIIRKDDPKIKTATLIQTICDALNSNENFQGNVANCSSTSSTLLNSTDFICNIREVLSALKHQLLLFIQEIGNRCMESF